MVGGLMSDTRTMWKPIQGADIRLTQPIETVGQQAIPWCTTHDISKDIPNPNPAADRPEDCLLAEYREGECVISRGGPKHKWWVDV